MVECSPYKALKYSNSMDILGHVRPGYCFYYLRAIYVISTSFIVVKKDNTVLYVVNLSSPMYGAMHVSHN